jgi:hypothetical protein
MFPMGGECIYKYRVSIKSFPDYKHLLQETYVDYKYIYFFNVTQLKKFFYNALVHFNKNVCIPRGFLVINFCDQGKTLCSPCITWLNVRDQRVSQMASSSLNKGTDISVYYKHHSSVIG